MADERPEFGKEPYEFILRNIESIPHLEALILLWNSRPVAWTVDELSSRLYVKPQHVAGILRDLVELQLAEERQEPPTRFAYFQRSERQNELLQLVDTAYRRDLVQITNMIHTKRVSPLDEFARAFLIKKERSR